MTPSFLFHSFLFLSFLSVNLIAAQNNGSTTTLNVGVVLDMDSPTGRVGWCCISMALDDFYAANANYSMRLVLNFLNSSRDVVGAGFAGLPCTWAHGRPCVILGVRPYVPRQNALDDFRIRWNKKFRQENPVLDRAELNVFGLWAYDTAWILAMAVERIGLTTLATNTSIIAFNSTNFASINTSPIGENLLQQILNTRFQRLSGDFHLINGQLQSSIFQIVNMVGRGERQVGFWITKHGISQDLDVSSNTMYMTSVTSGKKLKIAVPYTGFTDFVKVDHDTSTNTTIIKGYSIDIFKAVVDSLPYALPYEFVPFEICKGVNTYDDVIYQVYLQKFDAVVGTTTITANRSLYVDFTLPYTDGGVSMLVPIKFDEPKSAWFFSEPLTTKELWFTILAFFILTGHVVWLLEHNSSKAFRGPPPKQLSMILWFRLSTLVFAHRERLVSNLTWFIVMIWIFVVLVLTSTYTASLSSILTVNRLQPAVTSVQDLIKNGDYVGYQEGAFMRDMLKGMKFDESKIKSFNSIEDCDNALSKGSRNGGISAYFDVTPYIKGIIAKHCDKYIEVGPVNKTDGFGFIFSRGSPLVGDISRAILNITQGDQMIEIDRTWYGIQPSSCLEQNKKSKSSSLSLYNFRGLFIITGTVSVLALVIFLGKFLKNNGNILKKPPNTGTDTFWNRFKAMLEKFDDRDPALDEVNLRLNILRQFVEEIIAAAAPAPPNVPAEATLVTDGQIVDVPDPDVLAIAEPVPDTRQRIGKNGMGLVPDGLELVEKRHKSF